MNHSYILHPLLALFVGVLLAGCGGGGGGGGAGQSTLPTVSISVPSNTITLGQSVKLSWSSTNATSCVASASPSESDWSGAELMSGSQTVTPAASGMVTYQLVCTGPGGSAPGSAAVTANASSVLNITSGPLPEGMDTKAYGTLHKVRGRPIGTFAADYFQLTATGGTGSYIWSWAAALGSSLPPGIQCCTLFFHTQFPPTSASVYGAIYGTPTAPGTYHVVVTVTESGSPTVQTSVPYAVTIAPPPPPVINATAPAIGTLNSPYVGFTFTASEGFPPFTWSKTGSLPTGMQLSPAGVLSGTPTMAGSFPITVMVQDSVGQKSAPQVFTIQILAQGFMLTGGMATPRVWHTAALLGNGDVLVAGGVNNVTFPATAEIYSPATTTFAQTTGSPTAIRVAATATTLSSGKVLLVGGKNPNGVDVLTTAELYNPATQTFTATGGSMSDGRVYDTATLLNDGTVLLTGGLDTAGGASGTPVATAEIYSPTTDSFALTGPMTTGRFFHTATLLQNGMVLITGGLNNGQPLATAEIYSPIAKTFSSAGTMTIARMGHTATLLGSGKVLIAGGASTFFGGPATNAAELYDPSSGRFAATNPMISPRSAHTATLLPKGQVLIAGGASAFYRSGTSNSLSAAELFDPTTGNFAATADMTAVRESQTATLLNTGEVLVVGGSNGTLGYSTTTTVLATAELYQ
jgi:hypothetical protein